MLPGDWAGVSGQERPEGGARALPEWPGHRSWKDTRDPRSSLGSAWLAWLSSSKRHMLPLEWALVEVAWSSTELTGGLLQGVAGEETGRQTLHKKRWEASKARAADPGDTLTSPVATSADGASKLSPQRSDHKGAVCRASSGLIYFHSLQTTDGTPWAGSQRKSWPPPPDF